MAPLPAPPDVGSTSVPGIQVHSQPTTLPPGRPLQREGARFFLSAAEQAMEDAMNRSSSLIPALSLGRGPLKADNPEDRNDPEKDETFLRQCSPRQRRLPLAT